MRPATLLLVLTATSLGAQSPAPGAQGSVRAKPIQDNSFLLEEAYNQEAGVIQHISGVVFDRESSSWAYSFTQEWPVTGQKHQLSYTIPVQKVEGIGTGIGDVALNYRYQLVGSGETKLAATPRLTLLFPTTSDKFGGGAFGIQGAMASSYEASPRIVLHTNAGFTLRPSVDAGTGAKERLLDFNAGQSVILLLSQRFNLMLEGVLENEEGFSGAGSRIRSTGLTLSPGFRWSHDFDSGLQIVPGMAFPFGFNANEGQRGVLVYLSFEHPLKALEK